MHKLDGCCGVLKKHKVMGVLRFVSIEEEGNLENTNIIWLGWHCIDVGL